MSKGDIQFNYNTGDQKINGVYFSGQFKVFLKWIEELMSNNDKTKEGRRDNVSTNFLHL